MFLIQLILNFTRKIIFSKIFKEILLRRVVPHLTQDREGNRNTETRLSKGEGHGVKGVDVLFPNLCFYKVREVEIDTTRVVD